MSHAHYLIQQIVEQAVAGKISPDEAAESILREDLLMELAILKPFKTGLTFELWVTEKSYGKQHHRPRLKVFDRQNQVNASVSIDDPIEVLAGTPITGRDWHALVRYIQVNRALLMRLWNEEIDQGQFMLDQQAV
jgi:hypothetical protein